MPFGLSNVPASFQDYINKILAKMLNIFVIVYLKDIFIYTKNPGQIHLNSIWWFFKQLKKYGFFTKFKKCQFHKDKVCFLKYVVSAQGILIKDKRIEEIKNWPKLKFVHDI